MELFISKYHNQWRPFTQVDARIDREQGRRMMTKPTSHCKQDKRTNAETEKKRALANMAETTSYTQNCFTSFSNFSP